jgi:hypothetical protein
MNDNTPSETICVNCGEYFGKHSCWSSNCPIIQNQRHLGYKEHAYFQTGLVTKCNLDK